MKLEIKDIKTGDYVILESDSVIQFELIPENEEEKKQLYWGTRMGVKGFINDLEKAYKK